MPFTFAHPAAVLPFKYLPKKWISMTALVIGSMSPDFEYFFRLKATTEYSHTWLGLFWFDLPLTIILAFIYHGIVRDTLIDNLPSFLSIRLHRFKKFNWTSYFKENYPIVIISAIVGAATHILWDGITHEDRQFVELIPALKDSVSLFGFALPVYKILQHSSTAIGILLIFYSLMNLQSENFTYKKRTIFLYWISVLLISFALAVIKILAGWNFNYSDLIVTFISGSLLGLVLASFLFRKRVEIEIANS